MKTKSYYIIIAYIVSILSFVGCKKDNNTISLNNSTQKIDCSKRIIESNTTWTNQNSDPNAIDYEVSCLIIVQKAAILTIEPGVRIKFTGAGSGLLMQDDGGLSAIGTADNPIILEGSTRTKGDWSGVIIRANNPSTTFQYVTFKDAGAGTAVSALDKAGLVLQTSTAGNNSISRVTNCRFENNKGNGLMAQYEVVVNSFYGNYFANNELAPIKIDAFNLNMLDNTNTYVDNGQNYIDVYKGHATNGYQNNIKANKIVLPYRVAANQKLMLKAGEFNIEPGAVFEMGANSEITIYDAASSSAKITANGTLLEPIIFKGVEDLTGYWKGISIGTNLTNQLSYCTIKNAGSAAITTYDPDFLTGILVTKSTPGKATISNCTVEKSGGYGIVYGSTRSTVSISGNSYSNNTLSNVFTF